MPLPDFIIIGAMKCGTSTLAAQLAAQSGVFMTTPKEPNFFSDDEIYARGPGWYGRLFDAAPPGALKGEASTHYAKLPTHPHSVERIAAAVPQVRIVYVTRDPFARLVSHYVHEVSQGVIRCDLATALDRHRELIDYGRYAFQIAPYVARFGADRIHLTSAEALRADPRLELTRLGGFLGPPTPFAWRDDLPDENVSTERIRDFPLRRLLLDNPVMATARRTLVPKALRTAVRDRLRMRDRPELSAAMRSRLAPIFAADRAELARLLPQAGL